MNTAVNRKFLSPKILTVAVALFALLAVQAPAHAGPDGLITKQSKYSVKVTLDKLEAVLKKKGITIVTRWSHDAGAKKAGIDLRPTELLIFGNPKLGSHMFTSKQTSGIDLPMKALAWQDADGKVWLSYNDPAYITKRHGINDRDKVKAKMTGALNKLTNVATGN